MTSDLREIRIRPQQGNGWLLPLVALFAYLFAAEMIRLEVRLVWWLPASVLVVVAFFLQPFVIPTAVVIKPGVRSMEMLYLLRKSRSFSFDELESVESRVELVGDNDPEVRLVLRLRRGDTKIVLKREAPEWDPSALFGWSGCREPCEIEALRKEVASVTGVRDLGFLGAADPLRGR